MKRMRVVRRVLGFGLFVGALALGWAFGGRNSSPISVDYLLGMTPAAPLWGVLLGAFVLGAGGVGAWGAFQVAKLQLVGRRYRKKIEALESEVHQLRNLPLADEPGLADPLIADTAPGSALGRGA
jgi:uncharacterized integral membrane protein